MKKILVPLIGDDVAPRFDLAPEALIALVDDNGIITEDRTIILDEASAETLCKLVLTEKVDIVVCCGIEDEYYSTLVLEESPGIRFRHGSVCGRNKARCRRRSPTKRMMLIDL